MFALTSYWEGFDRRRDDLVVRRVGLHDTVESERPRQGLRPNDRWQVADELLDVRIGQLQRRANRFVVRNFSATSSTMGSVITTR